MQCLTHSAPITQLSIVAYDRILCGDDHTVYIANIDSADLLVSPMDMYDPIKTPTILPYVPLIAIDVFV